MLTHDERISSAKKAVESLLRARRAVKLYPQGSPVLERAVNELHSDLSKLLETQDRVSLEITQDSVFFELEEIFHAASAENNIPLLLFRDGVREIVFKKGLPIGEVSDFVHVVSSDLEREVAADDVVTRMWDRDFRHIRLIVFEPDIFTVPESSASPEAKDANINDIASELMTAHKEASIKEDENGGLPDVMEFGDDELISLRKDIERNPVDKTGKLLAIMLELFLLADTEEEYREIEGIMKRAVLHALEEGRINVLADFFMNVKNSYMASPVEKGFNVNLSRIFSFFSSEGFLEKVGSLMDSGLRIDEETIGKLTLFLDSRSIPVLINLLGHLETISARKTVVNMIGEIGKTDVSSVTEALGDDRWYVVRNIVIALRKIGDRQARRSLIKIAEHQDVRVRMEAARALAQIEGSDAVGILNKFLDDRERTVRMAALSALSDIGTQPARTLLWDKVRGSGFLNRDYDEKKEYFRVLVRFQDDNVRRLLGDLLLRKTFFRSGKNDENRAAIAYNVAATGDKNLLPHLHKIRNTGSELLRRTVDESIRKIENA